MAVGIDIGSKSIKVVELEKKQNSWLLKGSGVVGYSGVMVENARDEKELTPLADIIRRLVKEANVSTYDVRVSLPERLSFVKVVNFPLLSDQEIDAALKWEMDQYVPIPLEEAIAQHQVILRDDKSNPPQVKVLLVAARRAVVEKYTTLVEMAGLTPTAVENELLSLTRSIALPQGISVLVNFGAIATDIGIARDGKLYFSRSINVGGDALTRAIVQESRIEPLQAEEYKKTYGLSSTELEGKVRRALDPLMKYLVDEIKKAIQYFSVEELRGEKPSQMIITGGSVGLPGLISYLTGQFGLEVVVGNSFGKVQIPAGVENQLANYLPLYGVAVGLALRDDKSL